MRAMLVGMVAAALGMAALPASASAVTCTTPPTAEVRSERIFTPNCTGGGMIVFSITAQPQHGQLVGVPFSLGTQIKYVANVGYEGPDSFSYRGDGAGGMSEEVTQQIVVTPTANQAPSCSASPPETLLRVGAQRTVSIICTDADGDSLTLEPVEPADHGTVAVSQSGNRFDVTYDATSVGTDVVSYRASDGIAESAAVAFTMDVKAADYNTLPQCRIQRLPGEPADAPLEVSAWATWTQLPVGCWDAEGDPVTTAISTQPAHGTAGANPLTYDADDDYAGPDELAFTASDGRGTTEPIVVPLTVRAPRAPYGCVVDVTTLDDRIYAGQSTRLHLRCEPGDDGPPTVVIDEQPQHGTLTCGPTWSWDCTYTPDAGFVGTDTVTWRAVTPRGLDSGPQTSDLEVVNQSGNADPACHASMMMSVVHADAERRVRFACSQIEPGDDLAFVVTDAPDHGDLVDLDEEDPDLALTYRPDADADGWDTFSVRIVDGRGGRTLPIQIGMTVVPPDVNETPLCRGGTFDAPGGYRLFDCIDVEEDPVTLTLMTPPAHGSVSFLPAGAGFAYQADAGFSGTDAFAVRVVDDHGADDVRQYTITVAAPAAGGGGAPADAARSEASTGDESPSDPPGAGPPPAPAAPAPPSVPTTLRAAPLDLGPADAFLAPGADDGTVDVGATGSAPVLVVTCDAACTVRARTELLMPRAAPRAAHAAAARRVALPVQRLRLAAGRSGTVRVRVPARVRRQLGGRRTLTARLTLAVRHGGGRVTRDTMTTKIRLRR